jgi:hypothetical protein
MRLDEWVFRAGEGAISRLQSQTGLSYTAVHKAVRGKSKPTYETALRLSAATGGMVTADAICDPLEVAGRARRHKPRPKPRPKRKRPPSKRRSAEAQPIAAAAVA